VARDTDTSAMQQDHQLHENIVPLRIAPADMFNALIEGGFCERLRGTWSCNSLERAGAAGQVLFIRSHERAAICVHACKLSCSNECKSHGMQYC